MGKKIKARMRRTDGPRYTRRPKPKPKQGERAPLHKPNTLRIIPVGGYEENGGRNCTVFQYNHDYIIVDIGLQWPEDDMPGIDYIIPDLGFLRGREKQIRGIVVTHGHYDHTGGVPHWAPILGNPPIYASDLTCAMLQKKMEDIAPGKKLKVNQVKSRDRVKLGSFRLEFFGLSHNIPGSLGVVIETPAGKIVHTGDFKLDERAHVTNRTDLEAIRQLGNRKITGLMCDSTNSHVSGRQLPESEIEKNIDLMFTQTKGRIIFATFASLLSRIQQILSMAERYHRHVYLMGYSMKTNVEIGKQLGYIRVKPDTILSWEQIKKMPSHRYVIICTGAQGEDNAALMRIANREDKNVRVERGDLVVFSSSVVPGNERAVERLKDGLLREGADIIDSHMLDIHAGGHAKQGDIAELIKMVRPRYFFPVEGSYSHQIESKKLAKSLGYTDQHIVMADNGQVVEVNNGQMYVTNERLPIDYVFVDGLGIGDVNHIVLRDRKQLAGDGMVLVVIPISSRTGKPGKIDIISRGLTLMQEQGRLIGEMVATVKKSVKDREPKMKPLDKELREKVRHDLEKYIFQKTHRQPLVVPVIMET